VLLRCYEKRNFTPVHLAAWLYNWVCGQQGTKPVWDFMLGLQVPTPSPDCCLGVKFFSLSLVLVHAAALGHLLFPRKICHCQLTETLTTQKGIHTHTHACTHAHTHTHKHQQTSYTSKQTPYTHAYVHAAGHLKVITVCWVSP